MSVGKVRSVVVYSNMNAGIRDTEERNEILQSYSVTDSRRQLVQRIE